MPSPTEIQSRSFADEQGVAWRVRATMPTSRAAAALPSEFSRGWLVFESAAGDVRRLAPIPDGWQTAPSDELERLRRLATESRLRVDGLTGEVRRYEPGQNDEAGT
ncbi:MAG: hypothetical protein ACJ8AO_06470 [Gemmatimonadaceae bacterium]